MVLPTLSPSIPYKLKRPLAGRIIPSDKTGKGIAIQTPSQPDEVWGWFGVLVQFEFNPSADYADYAERTEQLSLPSHAHQGLHNSRIVWLICVICGWVEFQNAPVPGLFMS